MRRATGSRSMDRIEGATMLQRFIRERVASYREPQRAGTPKGELIGLSKTKFEATLWMLTNHLQKDLAPRLGISYGLLRKWNAEEEFTATIAKHSSDFSAVVLQDLIRRAQASSVSCPTHQANQDLHSVAKRADESFDDYADAGFYGEAFLETIYSSLLKKIFKQGDEPACESCRASLALQIYTFVHALMQYRGYQQEVERRSDERLKRRSHGCLLSYMMGFFEESEVAPGQSWMAKAMLARMKKVDEE
jgi:hypothetical protein